MNRIKGLDTIRFVCALWVTLSHVGLPPVFGNNPQGVLRALDGALHSLINGPAAVIVFFVISGFCIHYPFRSGAFPHLPSYYARRLLRIGLPLAAALLLSYALGYVVEVVETVVWSLVAEIIYYLVYPGLLKMRQRFGWNRLILAAFAIAVVVAATKPGAGNYPSFGHGLNWLVGLPVWLLGCRLAEQSDVLPECGRFNIWLWRGGIFLLSLSAMILRWHFPISIGFPWSLNLFSLAVVPWLAQEIIHFRRQTPPRLLEWAGAWSYSQYLMHVPLFMAIANIPVGAAVAQARSWLLVPLLLVFAYVFYRLVEYPGHLAAVKVGNRLKPPSVRKPIPEVPLNPAQ